MAQLGSLFTTLLEQQKKSSDSLPPVDKWAPPFCGDMDLVIRRDGAWVHQGDPIKREALVKLFSTVLKREEDEYFLVTPVEKLRIRVECAPFLVVDVKRCRQGDQSALLFTTNTGDQVIASADNPIWMQTLQSEALPFITVRSNLPGLLNRAVYYQLAEWAEYQLLEGQQVGGVTSLGAFFPLE
ncbi:DUF1285 domain-containing protein [bacterium SCSIO 12696]|nr:DUF1285 domain-containing protein [bacterium SCSIO 12696]